MMRVVIVMKKGDLLADFVSHDGISQTIVKLHGWGVHGRIMELLMGSPWDMDDEVHFFLRPDASSEDGVMVEIQREDDSWMH